MNRILFFAKGAAAKQKKKKQLIIEVTEVSLIVEPTSSGDISSVSAT